MLDQETNSWFLGWFYHIYYYYIYTSIVITYVYIIKTRIGYKF